jgi:hypothetical protein
MVHAHNEKVKATPFHHTHALPEPRLPAPPFQADPETVRRLSWAALQQGVWSLPMPPL